MSSIITDDDKILGTLVLAVLIASAYGYAKGMVPWWSGFVGVFMILIVVSIVESTYASQRAKTRQPMELALTGTFS